MAKLAPARAAALHTLEVARERKAYVRELLASAAGEKGREGLSERDAAFAERLAIGVTATIGTLDEAIDSYVNKPQALDPSVRDALRISAYELLFLGKEPHAAVSQGVELVKTRAKSAAGLANAVLRRVGESRDGFMRASKAHKYGLPPWLCDRIADELGARALDCFGKAGLSQAPAYLASIPMTLPDDQAQEAFQAAGVSVKAACGAPGSWRAGSASHAVTCSLVTGDPIRAVVTDLGAQVVACIASPEPGERMLEVGSGRGTKSILMEGHAFRRGGFADIWALDVHEGRSDVAANRLARAHAQGVTQVMGDARNLEAVQGLPAEFDRILIDAPCSGTGTLRRHPEIAWSLTPEDVDALAATQRAMLASCAGRLKVGGYLTYATCSVLCEENEDVVESFLDSGQGRDFGVVTPGRAARNTALAADIMDHTSPDGYLRTLVREDGCDGHFCAVLKRMR